MGVCEVTNKQKQSTMKTRNKGPGTREQGKTRNKGKGEPARKSAIFYNKFQNKKK